MVLAFLEEWTDFKLGHHAELTCHGPDAGVEASVAMSRIREARLLFGLERDRAETNPRWTIGDSQIEAAVRFALDDDQFPKQRLPPTYFHFYYRFVWKDFQKLPYKSSDESKRDGMSNLGLSFGYKGLFLQPTFVFPAPWTSEFLKDFIVRIEGKAPFRFRDQYFKRWIPLTRRATGSRGKLSIPATRQIATRQGRHVNLHKSWRTPIV